MRDCKSGKDMSIVLIYRHRISKARTRHLFVAKQFSDRSIRPVARLSMFQSPVGTRYLFAYLPEEKEISEFSPFLSFPELGTVYESDELFPLFENRVMGRNRPEFSEFVASLNLDEKAEPFEILERSGGPRETNNIEVFPEPEYDPTSGLHTCRFFVRGLRHSEGAFEAADRRCASVNGSMARNPRAASRKSVGLTRVPSCGVPCFEAPSRVFVFLPPIIQDQKRHC